MTSITGESLVQFPNTSCLEGRIVLYINDVNTISLDWLNPRLSYSWHVGEMQLG